VGKIAREKGVWEKSLQPPEANWDLKAEPPELGKNLEIFSKKIRNFKRILIHILLEFIILNTAKYVGALLKSA